MRSRQPKQLLLAFFGEHVVDQDVPPLRATALIEVLEGAGVAAPATRATLDRLVQRGLLTRERRGRGIVFSLTRRGRRRAPRGDRARARPASVPAARHRLDARDLHAARGSAHAAASPALHSDLGGLRPASGRAVARAGRGRSRGRPRTAPRAISRPALTAFHARELPGYAMADSVRAAWDIDRIRDEHLAFIDTWSDPDAAAPAAPSSARAMLVADWLALLAADPRLPREFMDDDWPADRSYEVYWAARRSLDAASTAQFAALRRDAQRRRASTSLEPQRPARAGRPCAPFPMPSRQLVDDHDVLRQLEPRDAAVEPRPDVLEA